MIGRTSTPGWRMSTSRNEMPLCLGASGSVRREHEDVIGEVAGRRPDLLAVDHPLVAVEHRPAARGCRGRSRRSARSSPGTRCPRRTGCAAGSAASAPRCPTAAACCRASGCRTRRSGPPGGHAGLGELLGDDHLLERRQAGAAVLASASRRREQPVLVERLAPLEGELVDLVALERADALPSGGRCSARNACTFSR